MVVNSSLKVAEHSFRSLWVYSFAKSWQGKGCSSQAEHEDPQGTFFCDQHDFLVATDALFSKGDKRISCCGNLISTLISGQKM